MFRLLKSDPAQLFEKLEIQARSVKHPLVSFCVRNFVEAKIYAQALADSLEVGNISS